MSHDALTAVLHFVVPNGPPVIQTLVNQPVHIHLRLIFVEDAAFREQVLFHVADGVFPGLKALQVLLAHQHHFNQQKNFVGMLLQRLEPLSHELAEFIKILSP
jgi:hypothetical protein